MGHFCRICKSRRPTEAFSGRGHRSHVCKRCARMPKDERREIEQADEVFGFLRQKHTSEKNVSKLKTLAASTNSNTAKLASIVLEVA